MSQRKTTKRQRHNRAARLLSEIYEIDYWLTMKLYNHFDRSIAVTKMAIKQLVEARHELDVIDTHNYSF